MPKRLHRQLTSPDALVCRLQELIGAGSGLDVFEEAFKLLVAKLWDEHRPGAARFRPGRTPAGCRADLDGLLGDAADAWPGLLGDPRSALRDTLLAACVEVIAPFTLRATPVEVMDAAFEQLTAPASKGAKGQYFTPRHVIDLCVRLLPPSPGDRVADPACGSGGFLLAAAQAAPGVQVTGWDFDRRAIRVARTLLLIAGVRTGEVGFRNALLEPSEAEGTFDRVLTNPPFAGQIAERSVLDRYDLGRERKRTERDALFVERSVRLLAPGGTAAIVLPHNKLGAKRWSHLREWLLPRVEVLGVIGLPRTTFMPHTHQKTAILVLRRPAGPPRDLPVLFALSERSGKDHRGAPVPREHAPRFGAPWHRLDHDFGMIADRFAAHLAEVG